MKQDPNKTVFPPITGKNVEEQAEQEKLMKQSLKEWSRKTLGEDYKEEHVSRTFSALEGTVRYSTLVPLTMGTSVFAAYFLLLMFFQVALDATDKKLSEELKKSAVNNFAKGTITLLIDALNEQTEKSVFNKFLAEVLTKNKFGYLGTPTEKAVVQSAVERVQKVPKQEFDDYDPTRYLVNDPLLHGRN